MESQIQARDYQLTAAAWLSRLRVGLIVSPAGSGKTIIAAISLKRVIEAKPRERAVKIGWLANTTEQVQQGRKAVKSILTPGTADVRFACAAGNKDWSDCDVLIVDEAHHSTAPQWKSQIDSCEGAVWGFTATPKIAPERDKALSDMFLGNIYTIDREVIQDNLAKAKVVMLNHTDPDLKQLIDDRIKSTVQWRKRFWKGDPGKLYSIVAWQTCIEIGIVNNHKRNRAAIAAAQNHSSGGDHVLVLVNQIEHGAVIAEQIQGARMCHSKMGSEKRRDALKAFKDGRCRCLVATSLADEGLDLPIANVLVLVSGGRSQAKAEQRTGRVLRTFSGKTHGLIYDFEDKTHQIMERHSQARQKLYETLGYEITK